MTIYFMGTEAEDFASRLGTVTHATSGPRRGANGRAAVGVSANSEDLSYIETDAFSSSDFWTHIVHGSTGGPSTQNFIKWYSGGTQQLAFHYAVVGTGQLEIRKWTGAAWTSLATVTDPMYQPFGNTTYVYVFYIKLGNPGTFGVYVNGLPAISLNNLDLSGIGAIDRVRLQSSVSSGVGYFSEVVVADFNLIGCKVVHRPPTGNGSYQEWTNGGFAVVDDQDATGADLAVSGTVGQRTTYTHAALTALTSTEVVAGVKVAAAVNRDAGGPQNINFMTRISTTDYNGADTALNVTQTRIGKVWETSPATAVAWTIAEINAAHMGVRSRT